LLLAEQYPVIKEFISLPGINIIPAINLLLLLQIEKAKSLSSLKILRRGRLPHSSQAELKSSRSMLRTRRTSFKRRIRVFFYLNSRCRKYISGKGKAGGGQKMLAHIFEQWKERLRTLEPENIPLDRPFPDRSLYGWPAVEGQRAVDNKR